jgi:hypothetical protein
MSKAKPKLTILVSSTVYGIEELLDRVYTLLTRYGYDVWMSHKGPCRCGPIARRFRTASLR